MDGRTTGSVLSGLSTPQGHAALVMGRGHYNHRSKGGAGPALAPRGSAPLPRYGHGVRNPPALPGPTGPARRHHGTPGGGAPGAARRPAPRGQPSAWPARRAAELERPPPARQVGDSPNHSARQPAGRGAGGGKRDRQRLRPIRKRDPRGALHSVPGVSSSPRGAGFRDRKRPVPSASLPVPPPPPPSAGCSGW